MLDVLEIRNSYRVAIGILDTAKSVIWHRVYYGVGDFEIYAQATEQNLRLLQIGNFVTRPGDDEVGLIESYSFTFNTNDGYMIVASGRFAKSILDRRIICNLSGTTNTPEILTGSVEDAARSLVSKNAVACSWDSKRNIPILKVAASQGFTPVIIDDNGDPSQKQVACDNLLTWTDALLQQYGMGSMVFLDEDRKLAYKAIHGTDRSTANTGGRDPVIFSVEFDNLISCEYDEDTTPEKTTAIIGGAGEGTERFYATVGPDAQGMGLREIFVNASSQNRKLKAEDLSAAWPSGTFSGDDFLVNGVVYATKEAEGDEYVFADDVYAAILQQQGRQQLATMVKAQNFTGEINASATQWRYGVDYFLGDIVTVQDNNIGVYGHFRITDVTEVNDENGYSVAVKFGE